MFIVPKYHSVMNTHMVWLFFEEMRYYQPFVSLFLLCSEEIHLICYKSSIKNLLEMLAIYGIHFQGYDMQKQRAVLRKI